MYKLIAVLVLALGACSPRAGHEVGYESFEAVKELEGIEICVVNNSIDAMRIHLDGVYKTSVYPGEHKGVEVPAYLNSITTSVTATGGGAYLSPSPRSFGESPRWLWVITTSFIQSELSLTATDHTICDG